MAELFVKLPVDSLLQTDEPVPLSTEIRLEFGMLDSSVCTPGYRNEGIGMKIEWKKRNILMKLEEQEWGIGMEIGMKGEEYRNEKRRIGMKLEEYRNENREYRNEKRRIGMKLEEYRNENRGV